MKTLQGRAIIAGLLVVVIAAAGWFGLISPKNSEASTLKSQAAEARDKAGALDAKYKQLEEQAQKLPEKQAQIDELNLRLPDSPGAPALVRSLTSNAEKSDVKIQALTNANPVDGVSSVTVPAAAPAATPAPAATDPKAAPDADAPAVPNTKPAPPPFAQISLTIAVDGKYANLNDFVRSLEDLPRSMVVDGFTIKPADDSSTTLKGIINVRVFFQPAAPDASASTPTAGSAPSGATG